MYVAKDQHSDLAKLSTSEDYEGTNLEPLLLQIKKSLVIINLIEDNNH